MVGDAKEGAAAKTKRGAAAKERMKKRKLRSDSHQTQITKLKEDAARLESELAALAREQAEIKMDKIRAEEKAQYEVNSAEMEMIFAGKQRTLSKYWRGCKVVVLQQQFDEKQARKVLRPPNERSIVAGTHSVHPLERKGFIVTSCNAEPEAQNFRQQPQQNCLT